MDICFHQIHPPWLTRLGPSITVSNGRGPESAVITPGWYIVPQAFPPVVLHAAIRPNTINIHPNVPCRSRHRGHLLVEHFIGLVSLIAHRLTHDPAKEREKQLAELGGKKNNNEEFNCFAFQTGTFVNLPKYRRVYTVIHKTRSIFRNTEPSVFPCVPL